MTIAKLVVEIEAQNRSLKSTLADSTRGVNAFAREIEKANRAMAALKPAEGFFGPDRGFEAQIARAREMSDQIVSGFRQQQKALKDLVKSGAIDKEEFGRRGQELMQATIAGAKSQIKAFGGLRTEIENELLQGIEKGGLKGFQALDRGARNVKLADNFLNDLNTRTTRALQDIDTKIARGSISVAERSLRRAEAFANRNAELLAKIDEMERRGQMRPALRQAMESQVDPRGFGVGLSRTEAEKAFQESVGRIATLRNKLQQEINRTKLDLAGGLDPRAARNRVTEAFRQFKQGIQEERARVGEGVTDVVGAATQAVARQVAAAGNATRLLDRIIPTVANAARRGADVGRAFISGLASVARVIAGGAGAALFIPASLAASAAVRGIEAGRALVSGLVSATRGVRDRVRDSVIPSVTDAARRGLDAGRNLASGFLNAVRGTAERVRNALLPRVDDAIIRGQNYGRDVASGVLESMRGVAERVRSSILPVITNASARGIEIGRNLVSGVLSSIRGVADRIREAVVPRVAAATARGLEIGRSLTTSLMSAVRGVSDRVRAAIVPPVAAAASRGAEIGRAIAAGALSSVAGVATRIASSVIPPVASAVARGLEIGRSLVTGVLQTVRGVSQRGRDAVIPTVSNATARGLEIGRSLAVGAITAVRGVGDRIRGSVIPAATTAAQRGIEIGRSLASGAVSAVRGVAERVRNAIIPQATAATVRGAQIGSAIASGAVTAVRGVADRVRDSVIPRVADAAQRGVQMGRSFSSGVTTATRGTAERVRDSVVPRVADATARGAQMGLGFSRGVLTAVRGVSSFVRDAIFVRVADAARTGVDIGRSFASGVVSSLRGVSDRILASVVVPATEMARRGIEAGRQLGAGIIAPLRAVTDRLKQSVFLPAADMARRGIEAGNALATSLLTTVRGVGNRVRDAVVPAVQGVLQTGTLIGRSLVGGIATAIRREAGLFRDAIVVPIGEMTRSGIAAGRALADGVFSAVRGTSIRVRDAITPVVGDAVARGTAIGRGIAQGITSAVVGAGRVVSQTILPAAADVATAGAAIGVALAGGVVASVVGAGLKVRDALVPRNVADVLARGAQIGRSLAGGVLTAVRGVSAKIRDNVLVPVVDFARRGVDAGTSFVGGLFSQLRGVADRVRRAVLPPQTSVVTPKATNLGVAAPAAIEAEMAKALAGAEREVKRLMTTLDKTTGEGGTTAGTTFFKNFDAAMSSGSNASLTRVAAIGKSIGSTFLKFVTLPIAAAGVGATKLAGDAEQSAKRLQISFGPASVQLQRNLNALRNEIPATSSELQQMASRLGELIIPIGLSSEKVAEMSTNLIKVTKNISLFSGVSSDRAFNAVINGLVGQSRELKKLWIEIDDNTIADRAYREGIARTGAQLNTLQKVQAGYLVIMERTRLIEGTLAQSQDTFNVKLLFFQSRLKEAGIALGGVLLPYLTRFLVMITKAAESFVGLSEHTRNWVVGLAIAAATIGPLLLLISNITRALVIYRAAALAASLATAAGGAAGAGALGLGAIAAIGGPVAIAIGLVTAAIIAYTVATQKASKETQTFEAAIVGMSKKGLEAAKIALTSALNETQLQLAKKLAEGVHVETTVQVSQLGVAAITSGPQGGTKKQRDDFVALQKEVKRYQDEIARVDEELVKITKQEQDAAKFAKEFAASMKAIEADTKAGLLTEQIRQNVFELSRLRAAGAEAAKAFTVGRKVGDIDLMNEGLEKARETLSNVNVLLKQFNLARSDPANQKIIKNLDIQIAGANKLASAMKGIIQTAEGKDKLDQFSAKLSEIRKQLQLASKTEDFASQQEAFTALAELEKQAQQTLTKIGTQGDAELQSRLRALLSDVGLLREQFKTMVPIETFAKIDNVIARIKALQESGQGGGQILSTGIPLEKMEEGKRLLKELNDLQFRLNEKIVGQRLRGEDVTKSLQKLAATQKEINQITPNIFEQMFPDAVPKIQEIAAAINAAQAQMENAQLFGDPVQAEEGHRNMVRALGDLGRLRQAIIDALVAAGVSKEAIAKIMEQFGQAYKRAGGQAQDFAEKVDRGTRRLIRLGLLVGIIRQLSDAFGITNKNILNAIQSTGVLIASVQEFKRVQAESDKRRKEEADRKGVDVSQVGRTGSEMLALISAGIGIASSAFNVVRSIVEAFTGRSAEQTEHDKILQANNQQLSLLSSQLRGFTGALGDQTRIRAALQQSGTLSAAALPKSGAIGIDLFNKVITQFGTTFAEINEIAKQFGITLLDSSGRIIVAAFEQVAQAIDLAAEAATKFANTIDDQQKKIDLFNNVFDVEQTPAQIIQDQAALLAKLSPELFKQFFAGVDLGDPAAVKKAVQAMTKALLSGALDAKAFGALFGKDDLIRIIEGFETGLDQLTDTVNDANAAITNVPDWFKTNQVRFLSADPFNPNTLPPDIPPTIPEPPIGIDVNPTPPLGPRGSVSNTWTGDMIVTQAPGEDSESFAERIIEELRTWKFQRTGSTALPGIDN